MDLLPSPDRIALADDIFADALELPESERSGFVLRKCGGDASLCHSVLQLLSHYGRLGDFLDEPAARRSAEAVLEFQPGEILGQRFRIVRSLERGGIGEVYRAEDMKLQETVALKTLRPGARDNQFLAGRFQEELRLARKIGHANVCRVFDFFSQARGGMEIWYFTMEYLEGSTLAQRLKAGALHPEAALALTGQIAAGLDAAHALGIVHRDLKPANIMLVPDRGGERPVIMDFGLAKVLDPGQAGGGATQTGQIVGTPEDMAPEQLLGTEITPATDVYALGLIVFEMIAGRRPFPSESIIRSAVRRAMGPPPCLREVAPAAPAHWDAALRAALDNVPHRRPQSAAALVERLQSPPTRLAALRHLRKPGLSRRALLYGAGVGGLACIAAIFRLSSQKALIGTEQKGQTLMFTPLTQPADLGGDIRGGTVGLMLARTLGQSSRVQLLSRDQISAGWDLVRPRGDEALPATLEPSVARHIALVKDATLVLFGSISKVADEWSLTLRLEVVDNSPEQAKASRDGTFHNADAATVVVEASNWIRRALSEPEMQIQQHNRRPEELTTRNWHSLEQYEESEQAWETGAHDAAVEHLREALAGDPEFAMAAARLGDIFTGLGRPDEGLPYYERAEQVLVNRGLTDRESLQIRGMFALDTGRYEEAEHVFSLFMQEFPEDTVPLLHRATALDRLNRPEEAEKLLDTAIAREPKSYILLFRRAHLLLDEGRLEDAERDGDRAAAIANNDWTDQLRSAIAYGRLDMVGAALYLDRLKSAGSSRFQSKWFAFRASFLADSCDMAGAERALRDGIAFDLRTGLTAESHIGKRWQLAQVLLDEGRVAEARSECRTALESAPGMESRLQIASILARAGDRAGAAACVPEAEPKWPIQRYWLARLRGELALARGNANEALRLMNESSAGRTSGEFPAHLLRAAKAAGDAGTIRTYLQLLFTNPGRYWFQAATSEPGFVRLALSIARVGTFTETDAKAANTYRSLANYFMRRS